MNIQDINSQIVKIISKKKELSAMSYSDEKYDDCEEDLHQLEDEFLSKFGSIIEEALHEVHDEYCPDNDVLLPIAYLPNEIEIKPSGEIEVGRDQGVYVDVDDYDVSETKLVLVPNPVRILLNVGMNKQEVVWEARD